MLHGSDTLPWRGGTGGPHDLAEVKQSNRNFKIKDNKTIFEDYELLKRSKNEFYCTLVQKKKTNKVKFTLQSICFKPLNII